jgi:hypothetical protein
MPSSVVNHYFYFPDTEILRIIYQSGTVYDYLKVPADIVSQCKEARSKGINIIKYLNPF